MAACKVKRIIRQLIPDDVVGLLWHMPRSFLAAAINGFPARRLKVIGVAGTKGKTTTCDIISQILESAGKKVAMTSTALIKIGQKEELNSVKMTTPSPFFLQACLRRAVAAGCEYFVLETSSHALVQHRLLGVQFETVVLTNMMPDHLDYHKTKKAYTQSHFKMLNPEPELLVINGDDPNLTVFVEKPIKNTKKILFGVERPASIAACELNLSLSDTEFTLETPQATTKIRIPLLGRFNAYNALAAIATTINLGIEIEQIRESLAKLRGTPGRMERIASDRGFEVIVDYAHSVESLENLFEAVLPLKKRKIITVFGATGERDPGVRPLMGKVVSDRSDFVVVTNDDTYSDDPQRLADELIAGLKNKKPGTDLLVILDRRAAIEKAISLAEPNDLILILGKGAEQWQILGDKKIPWDDREVARQALSKKSSR